MLENVLWAGQILTLRNWADTLYEIVKNSIVLSA